MPYLHPDHHHPPIPIRHNPSPHPNPRESPTTVSEFSILLQFHDIMCSATPNFPPAYSQTKTRRLTLADDPVDPSMPWSGMEEFSECFSRSFHPSIPAWAKVPSPGLIGLNVSTSGGSCLRVNAAFDEAHKTIQNVDWIC